MPDRIMWSDLALSWTDLALLVLQSNVRLKNVIDVSKATELQIDVTELQTS